MRPVYDPSAVLFQVDRVPGIYTNEIGRAVGLCQPALLNILRRLRKDGLVITEKQGRLHHHFNAAAGYSAQERMVLATLNDPCARAMLEAILAQPGITATHICLRAGIADLTVKRQGRCLAERGLITIEKEQKRRYHHVVDPERIEAALAHLDRHDPDAVAKQARALAQPPRAGLSRITSELMDLVLECVSTQPGATSIQIADATKRGRAQVRFLLQSLEKRNEIVVDRRTPHRHHYFPPQGHLIPAERDLLIWLSRPNRRAVLEAVLRNPWIRHSELARAVDMPEPSVGYYARELVAKGVLSTREAEGRKRYYRVTHPELMADALARGEGSRDHRSP